MKIIAHRGHCASKASPENSLKAFSMSQDLGIEGIEIDIRTTRDNKLVVFHDASLRRLAGINRKVNRYSLAELSQIKLKNGESIPSLQQVLNIIKPETLLVIEGKGSGWSRYLSKELENYLKTRSIRVVAFNSIELTKFKQLRPHVSCYLYGQYGGYGIIRTARKHHFDGITIFYGVLHPYTYYLARRNNLGIMIFTLNYSIIAKQFHRLYKNADIITDRPIEIKKALS